MPNFNSPRYRRVFVQKQTNFLQFNNSAGVWTNTNAQVIRIPEGGFSMSRIAPYTPFPVVTGDRSTLTGVRGRKNATWEMRGIPLIPSGAAGTVSDLDLFFQCAFGAAPTVVASTSVTYAFTDTGAIPLSLLDFTHGSTSLTSRALWGGVVSRIVFNFNGSYLTMDLSGAGGYAIDSAGFSAFDTQAKAGLTAFPIEPSSPTTNGLPIAGFGTGYTATLDSQDLSLKVRVQNITFDTGLILVQDVYGSPYPIAMVGDTRTVALSLSALDDDSAALNDIKTKADTDNITINATIVAGTVAGSIITWTLRNIQPNAFNLTDNGAIVNFDMPTSMAHETSIGSLDELSLVMT